MSTEVDRSISPGAPPEGTLEAALYGVLTRTAYYKDKWKALRLRETSDDEIQAALSALIGEQGVSDSSRGICHIKPDKFWFGSYVIDREPDLEGAELIAKVREVLGLSKIAEEHGGNGKEDHAVPAQLSLFDYAQLDEETAIVVRDHAEQIKLVVRLVESTLKASAIDIGKRLLEVKERLGHGNFGKWLRAEFDWSDQTAQDFMNVARLAAQNPKFLEFEGVIARSALRLIAAPSTPEEARQEVLERAEAGEQVTHSEAKKIVESHKKTIWDLAEALRERGPLSRNEIWELGFRDSKITSALTHKLIRETEGGKFAPYEEQPQVDVSADESAAAEAAPKPGVCRVCGCTELEPCIVDEEENEECEWAVGERRTLCTNCRDLMQNRGLSEQALRERLRSRDEEGDLLESAAERLEPDAPAAEAEVIVTGRTDADLVSVVKANENGMLEADLLRMGFTSEQIERARLAGQIVKEIGKWYYNSEPAGAAPTTKAQPAATTEKRPARVEDLLKGRMLVVTYAYIPQLVGKVSVGVRIGDDPLKTAYESLDSSKVRQFPDRVLEMIAEQIKAADNNGGRKKPAEKKAAAAKRSKPAARNTAPSKKKPAAARAKNNPAKKTATNKKTATKRGAAKSGGR